MNYIVGQDRTEMKIELIHSYVNENNEVRFSYSLLFYMKSLIYAQSVECFASQWFALLSTKLGS